MAFPDRHYLLHRPPKGSSLTHTWFISRTEDLLKLSATEEVFPIILLLLSHRNFFGGLAFWAYTLRFPFLNSIILYSQINSEILGWFQLCWTIVFSVLTLTGLSQVQRIERLTEKCVSLGIRSSKKNQSPGVGKMNKRKWVFFFF